MIDLTSITSFTPGPGRLLGLITGLLIASVATAGDAGVIRNIAPQTAEPPEDIEWPIYYSRHQRATLDAAAGTPGSPEHLLRRFLNLHAAMRYADALEVAVEIIALAPDRPLPHYNHACILARLHRTDEAFAALDRAIDCGWRHVAQMEIDADLARLRKDPRFARLLERTGDLAAEEALPSGPHAGQPWPETVQVLESSVPALLDRYHVPGATIALLAGGEVVWSEAFGLTRLETASPLTADQGFALRAPADLIALVTAAQLDAIGAVPLRDVLAHVQDRDRPSGVTTIPTAFGSAPRRARSPERIRRSTTEHWPARSDDGVTRQLVKMISLAIEADYEGHVEAALLGPLGLASTTFDQDALASAASGYSMLGTEIPPTRGAAPDAFAVSTGSDLARLAAALMRSGEDDRLLENIVEHAFGAVTSDVTARGDRLQVADVAGGVGCLMRWYPEEGSGVVIVFNSVTGSDAALRIARLALGTD